MGAIDTAAGLDKADVLWLVTVVTNAGFKSGSLSTASATLWLSSTILRDAPAK